MTRQQEEAGKKLYSKEEFADRLEAASQKELPENLLKRVEGMVEGRVQKFLKQSCLLDQGYVMDDKKSVKDILNESNNEILKFYRYEVGEGIEKEEVNFADEVAAQANL